MAKNTGTTKQMQTPNQGYFTPSMEDKENSKESEESFYSVKSNYNLRNTPVRVFYQQGLTPMKGITVSSKKRRKNKKQIKNAFEMTELNEALPCPVEPFQEENAQIAEQVDEDDEAIEENQELVEPIEVQEEFVEEKDTIENDEFVIEMEFQEDIEQQFQDGYEKHERTIVNEIDEQTNQLKDPDTTLNVVQSISLMNISDCHISLISEDDISSNLEDNVFSEDENDENKQGNVEEKLDDKVKKSVGFSINSPIDSSVKKNRLSFIVYSPAPNKQNDNETAKKTVVRSNIKVQSSCKKIQSKITSSAKKTTPRRSLRSTVNACKTPMSSSRIAYLCASSVKKSAVKTTAEMIREYENTFRVYDRSRSLDRAAPGQRSRSSSRSSVTVPITPKLHSIHRNRVSRFGSKTEEEPKFTQFKATPLNRKILQPNYTKGIPKVPSGKKPTRPIGIEFQTDKRLEKRRDQSVGRNEPAKQEFAFKANPMPTFKKPIIKSISAPKLTHPRAFSFDERNKQAKIKRDLMLEQIKNKDLNIMFRANPMPNFPKVKLPLQLKNVGKN